MNPLRCSAPLSVLVLGLLFTAPVVHAQAVGEVDTVFKLFGPDHKIVVEAFDDPKVKGVTDASIECQQVGAVSFAGDPMKQQEVVFTERTSFLFKKLQVVRMVDKARNTLVYLSYSDRVIEGSPDNSITAVPLPAGTVIPMR